MLGERRSVVDCSHPHNREWPGTGGPEAEDERTHNRGTHQGGGEIFYGFPFELNVNINIYW